MPLGIDLPTDIADYAPEHTAGHNTANAAINATAAAVDTLDTRVQDLEDSPPGGTQVSIDGDDVGTLDIDSAVVTVGDLGLRVVSAAAPPSPIAAVVTDGTDQTARLQAMLDYASTTWGGGTVDVSFPGETVTCTGTTTGLVVPAGVQLRIDQTTRLHFPNLTGTAITISDTDFVPLVGGWLDGPNTGKTLAHSSIGVSVTGVRLRMYDVRISHFGRAHDWAHSETWLVSQTGGALHDNGTCLYLDNVAASASNAGEQMLLDNVTIFNSALGFKAVGNGVDLKIINGSIDFCTVFGYVADAWVWLNNMHLETASGSAGDLLAYLFNVRQNAKMFLDNVDCIIGGGSERECHFLFNPDEGPWNYANGQAQLGLVKVFFVGTDDVERTTYAADMVLFPASTTTLTVYTPMPLRWCLASAEFVVTDNGGLPAIDNGLRISASSASAGTVTLTAAASHSSDRWVRVRF